MSTSSRGSARERQYGALKEKEGWSVYRVAGSKGVADLVLLKGLPARHDRGRGELYVAFTDVELVQVKGDKGSPWTNFRKDERNRLRAEAAKVGAETYMVHMPTPKEIRVYHPHEWPT